MIPNSMSGRHNVSALDWFGVRNGSWSSANEQIKHKMMVAGERANERTRRWHTHRWWMENIKLVIHFHVASSQTARFAIAERFSQPFCKRFAIAIVDSIRSYGFSRSTDVFAFVRSKPRSASRVNRVQVLLAGLVTSSYSCKYAITSIGCLARVWVCVCVCCSCHIRITIAIVSATGFSLPLSA